MILHLERYIWQTFICHSVIQLIQMDITNRHLLLNFNDIEYLNYLQIFCDLYRSCQYIWLYE